MAARAQQRRNFGRDDSYSSALSVDSDEIPPQEGTLPWASPAAPTSQTGNGAADDAYYEYSSEDDAAASPTPTPSKGTTQPYVPVTQPPPAITVPAAHATVPPQSAAAAEVPPLDSPYSYEYEYRYQSEQGDTEAGVAPDSPHSYTYSFATEEGSEKESMVGAVPGVVEEMRGPVPAENENRTC